LASRDKIAANLSTKVFFPFLLSVAAFGQAPSSLESKATAILQARCLACHDASTKTAGLDLTSLEMARKGGKSGPALLPGNASESLLARRITAGQMPPGNPLPAAERTALLEWIGAGAPWSTPIQIARKRAGADWWSLQPLRPSGAQESIDSFISAALKKKGLQSSPPADRRTLIRRATFDLLGLPPTPQEIEAFLSDSRPDAYEQLIDRLLASPHYGERWGRHWLDVARFGESHGYEQNHLRERAWPYRDYVIRSFNQDKPFTQMVLEQLAGDQIAPGNPDIEVATGFLVAGPHDTVKIENIEGEVQQRANDLDDIVATTSTAFLGLTVGCARCHNHKFDPIPQADYYRLQAVFAGVQHAERDLATEEEKARHKALLDPLTKELDSVKQRVETLRKDGEPLVAAQQPAIDKRLRPAVDPKGTAETFAPQRVKFVRMTITECTHRSPPAIDEVEVWTAGATPANVALASHGAKVTARSTRSTNTATEAYRVENLIDGQYDQTWISGENGKGQFTIELPQPETVARIVWSRDKLGANEGRFTGQVATGYVMEGSLDGRDWKPLAASTGRLPYEKNERAEFYLTTVMSPAAREEWQGLQKRKAELEKQIAAVPKLPAAYAGKFTEPKEPAHILKRGNPMDKGDVVPPGGLTALNRLLAPFELEANAPEGQRRLALAKWITDDRNVLTARVLANRIWHYHFGKGLAGTPSDFGFNGEPPSHPELLDFLARRLQQLGWRLKPFHRELMLSATYRQSSASSAAGLDADNDDRLLWRFPPRRLEAEEVRDAVLSVSGKLNPAMGGPGFRLFKYTVDNVATYLPAETSSEDTWRRAVYQQSARSVKDDMLGTFDCPDSSQPEPKRFVTTTPLQALTMMNSRFAVDQAERFAERLKSEAGSDATAQVQLAFTLAFGRPPKPQETAASLELIRQHNLFIFCRALLNANEFLYVM
jgi:cytochrome c551/c552